MAKKIKQLDISQNIKEFKIFLNNFRSDVDKIRKSLRSGIDRKRKEYQAYVQEFRKKEKN